MRKIRERINITVTPWTKKINIEFEEEEEEEEEEIESDFIIRILLSCFSGTINLIYPPVEFILT